MRTNKKSNKKGKFKDAIRQEELRRRNTTEDDFYLQRFKRWVEC